MGGLYARLSDDFNEGRFSFRNCSPTAVALKYGASVEEANEALYKLADSVGRSIAPQMRKIFSREFFEAAEAKMKAAPRGCKDAVQRELYGQYFILLMEGDAARLANDCGTVGDPRFLADMMTGMAGRYEERFGGHLSGSLMFFVQELARCPIMDDIEEYVASREPKTVEGRMKHEPGLIYDGEPDGADEFEDNSLLDKFDAFMDSLESRVRDGSDGRPYQTLF